MYCKSDDVCSPVSCLCKVALVPLTLAHKLYRVREAESSEHEFIALRVYELVAFYLYPAFLGRFWSAGRHDECREAGHQYSLLHIKQILFKVIYIRVLRCHDDLCSISLESVVLVFYICREGVAQELVVMLIFI